MNDWPHLCRLQAEAERQRRRCNGHDVGRRRAQIPKKRSDIAAAAQKLYCSRIDAGTRSRLQIMAREHTCHAAACCSYQR